MPFEKPADQGNKTVDLDEPEPTIDELKREVYREPHDGDLTEPTDTYEFLDTQFVGFVNEMRQNRSRNLVFTIMVPYRWRKLAMPLSDAGEIPLSFDIKVWKKFADARSAASTTADD